jgi:hypothetical protein
MSKRIVGKCGHCGGKVTVPTMWHGVNPPVPQCESCGAQVDETAHLPTLPMLPLPKRPIGDDGGFESHNKYPVPPGWMLRRGLSMP